MELYQAEMVRWRGWAHDKTVERHAPGDVVYSLVSKNCVRFVGIAVQLSSLELTLVAPTTTVQSDTHVFSDIVIVGIVVGVYILFMMVTAGIFVMLRYRNIRVQRTAIDMENSVFRVDQDFGTVREQARPHNVTDDQIVVAIREIMVTKPDISSRQVYIDMKEVNKFVVSLNRDKYLRQRLHL